MNALTFQIRALQPLLVTQLGAGEENSSKTFDFIPGSVLRGVVINRYLREHRVTDVAQDSTYRRLFFEGAVRYLNAYPVNRSGQRTLPKPLSWRVSKDDKDNDYADIYDFAIELDKDIDNPVSPSGVFCWQEGRQVELGRPGCYVNVHNANEDRNVKRKGESTVYRYEAIAAGELFGAAILAEDQSDLQALRPFLDRAELNLGGSRSAEYGRVRFEQVRLDPDWHEYEPDDEPDEDVVILTLFSDAILRDANGHLTTNLDAVLGWKHWRAYQETRVIGGFNRKWGLPLVQATALQAGSVFVYQADQVDEQISRLKDEGIGERRAEGFGRVGINWHTQTRLQRRPAVRDSRIKPVSLSNESRQLAERMAGRRLRAMLDQKLIEGVSQLSIVNPPHNAQLSRLRLTVRRAWRERNPDLIANHLNDLKAAKEQFEQARIGGERLLSWLIKEIQGDHLWRTYLQPRLGPLPSIADVTAQLTEDLKLEYSMRLLDALLKKTARQARLEGGAE